jgi:hypothetical protein
MHACIMLDNALKATVASADTVAIAVSVEAVVAVAVIDGRTTTKPYQTTGRL